VIAAQFEQELAHFGFYFEVPGIFVPGSDKDAETYSAQALLDILDKETSKLEPQGGLRRMVRKRSESANNMTYYFKDEMGTQYFKVAVPVQTGAGTLLDMQAARHILKQIKDVLMVRLGVW